MKGERSDWCRLSDHVPRGRFLSLYSGPGAHEIEVDTAVINRELDKYGDRLVILTRPPLAVPRFWNQIIRAFSDLTRQDSFNFGEGFLVTREYGCLRVAVEADGLPQAPLLTDRQYNLFAQRIDRSLRAALIPYSITLMQSCGQIGRDEFLREVGVQQFHSPLLARVV